MSAVMIHCCAAGYVIAGCRAPRGLVPPGTRPECSADDPRVPSECTPVVTGIQAMPEWKRALHRLALKPEPKCRACYDTKMILVAFDVSNGYTESEPCPECAIVGEAA